MSVHIWCPRASDSAIHIRDVLHSAGISCFKTPPHLSKRGIKRFIDRVKPDDVWINWGPPYLDRFDNDVTFLNLTPHWNKQEQLIILAQNGIPCPEVFDSPATDRLGRSFKHQCASDLLRGNGTDYYTQRLQFVRECRIHIFGGKSIHAGMKVPREGATPHPWIRSSASGWKIDYSKSERILKDRRELAKKAVAALGLDFGAVDIGIVEDGRAAVIEVNTAPGLDIPTAEAYVKQLINLCTERG